MTRVRCRHDVEPLEYRVTWEQFDEIARCTTERGAGNIASGMVERVQNVLGPKQAAEVMFELASGRTPRFIPVSSEVKP